MSRGKLVYCVDSNVFRDRLNSNMVKAVYEPTRSTVISDFCSMKRLGVFLLSPGWDASPSQGYPQHSTCQYPSIHLGGERRRESVLPKKTTQFSRPGPEPGRFK